MLRPVCPPQAGVPSTGGAVGLGTTHPCQANPWLTSGISGLQVWPWAGSEASEEEGSWSRSS